MTMKSLSVHAVTLSVLVAAVPAHAAPRRGPEPRRPPAGDVAAAPRVTGAAAVTWLPRAAPDSTARPFGIAHAVSLRAFGDLTWSADGRRVAFVLADPDTSGSTTNYDVYVADLAKGRVRRVSDNRKGDASPSFSPGGDTLAYVATRTGDTRQRIYLQSLRGGGPWAFGSYDEAVGEVKWAPDGRWLAYTKNDTLPATIAERRRDRRDGAVEGERTQWAHAWAVEIATGARRRLTSGAQQVWNLRWSPDSKSVAYLTSPSGAIDDANEVDIGVVPIDGGPARTLGAIGGAFAWSPDSRAIAWAGGGDRTVYVEKDDAWVCDVAGGAPRRLTAGFDQNATPPAWNAAADTLFFFAPVGAATALEAVPAAGGPVRELGTIRGTAAQLTTAPGGRTVWIEAHTHDPDELYEAARPGLAGRGVTALNAAAARTRTGDAGTFRWTSTDGARVEGVVLRPADAPPDAALPTLVLLHGGPYGYRVDFGFNPLAQVYVSAGYQVFAPNFRSSAGYGEAFLMRERADWGGQDWRDVMTGVDSLVATGLADGGRLGVLGGSYGGYLTAWAITHTDRFRAAYIDRGIVNLPALWGQSDAQRYRAWEFGGRPWEAYDRMWERSPIRFIGRARTPTLIVVGDNDARTPIAQSRELYESLRSLGVPVEFVHYPREGHGLREPRHRADAMQRALAWFQRWIP